MYTFRNPAGLSAASGKEMGNAPASRTSQRPKAIIVYCFSQKNLSFSPSCIPSVCGRRCGRFSFFVIRFPYKGALLFPQPLYVRSGYIGGFAFAVFASPSRGFIFFTVFSKRACHKQRPICCFFAEGFPARRFPPNGGSHFAAVFHWPLVHAVPQK